jgi:hypothetical protein
MKVHTAQFVLRLPRDMNELVTELFNVSRKTLKKEGRHKPVVITLFDAGKDYVAYYHVLERDEGESKHVPSIEPIIRKEMPDAFIMVSESVVELTKKDSRGRFVPGPANKQGDALFLMFRSRTATRLVYQVFRRKYVNGKVKVRMGYMREMDEAPYMPGHGNLAEIELCRPSYIG